MCVLGVWFVFVVLCVGCVFVWLCGLCCVWLCVFVLCGVRWYVRVPVLCLWVVISGACCV